MADRSSVRLRQLADLRSAGGSALAQLAERVHLTVTGLGVLAFASGGWFLARLMASKTMFFLVYSGVLAVCIAWVVARRRLAVEVVRTNFPHRMRAGQALDIGLQITAHRRLSTILVKETLDASFEQEVTLPIAAMGNGDAITHQYTIKPPLRGVYAIGPTTATWSDPFGITTHSQVLAKPVQMIVHPTTELVHDRVLTRMWEDPPIRPPVSRPWPTGFEFYGLRDYVEGDDLRRVVWSAVAKTGKMLVRESEQGITDRVVIVIDTGRQYHSPGHPSLTFERAVNVAASIGVRHLTDGMSVTVTANQGMLGSGWRGQRARLLFLDELAKLALSDLPLADATKPLIESKTGATHVVVITPHIGHEEARRLRLLLNRGASIVVANLLWEETDPLSLQRAAVLGCRIIQVPLAGPLEAVFGRQIGVGVR